MANALSRIRQASLRNAGLDGRESLLAHYLRFLFGFFVRHDYMLCTALLPAEKQQDFFVELSKMEARLSEISTTKETEEYFASLPELLVKTGAGCSPV